ncbi:hypothetical protein LIER_03723 [Lithospermum erythrorhizon]|uniref:Uncharacterized protein n=1 Tax=Lithospermum erythrorhizon TaxID=34254 RepID=A0AAV3NU78_LITER
MKALSKPISSPGRTEKFPPPLMRFLRSNVGSRSRKSKSKSRPMFFFRRKNAGPINIETTQEPSSPKVTCIGQVKIRRSTKAFSKPKRSNSSIPKLSKQTPCWWIRRVLCCNMFFPRCPKPKCPKNIFKKWALFFRCGYCKKGETSLTRDDDSSRIESIPRVHNNNSSTTTSDVENSDFVACTTIIEVVPGLGPRATVMISHLEVVDQIQESKTEEDCINNASTPPKNAFLLTRCRSAPYRSSSLASRFWGSPLKDEENEEKDEEEENVINNEEEEGGICIATSPICKNEVAEPRFSSQSEQSEINVINISSREAKSIQDLRAVGGSAVHPLMLTRCKSEPARTGERLLVNPDAISFSKQRRLEVSQPCQQENDTPNCD